MPTTTTTPSLPHRPPRSLSSISGWARTGDSWPLKPPHAAAAAATIVSLLTRSPRRGGRKSAGWKMTASIHRESFRFFPPSHTSLSLFSLVLRHWYFPPSNVNNPKPKKRQLGYLRTWCFFCTLNKAPPPPRVDFWGGAGVPGVLLQALLYYIFFVLLFILLFLIKTCLEFTHTHLDESSWKSLPF